MIPVRSHSTKFPMPNTIFANSGTSIFETMSRLANEVQAVNLGQGFPEALEPPEVVEAAI